MKCTSYLILAVRSSAPSEPYSSHLIHMAMTAARIHPLFHVLTSGSLFRQYRLLEQIGVGGEGVVWSALDQNQGQIHAIKFKEAPDPAETEANDTGDKQQLEKLVGLQHAHILPILEYGFEAQMRFTVSPYIPGGTLTQRIKMAPLSIDEIVRCGTEIASALDYLHGQGVIHRDLKSQNILLDLRDNCYLTDFGLARLVTTSTLAFHTGHGTPPYASPEQIQSRALTPRSDLFSFGILLYEMFTGQLPWNGKKQLSMEQLNSKQELPDPREFNENLPFVLADLLRRVTAADPRQRPPSAAEIMQVIRRVFSMPAEALPVGKNDRAWAVRDADVEELLKRAFVQWNSTDETYNLGLTKFALVYLKRGKINMERYNHFLLSQALTYGYKDDQWWLAVRDPRERLAISSRLLRKHNEGITGRIVTHLAGDPNIVALPTGLPEGISSGLLEVGLKTDNAFLRREIFDGLRVLTQPRRAWGGPSSLDPDQSKRLGEFALEDSEFGDTAAGLIGHLRSAPAVRVLLNHPDEERKIAALLLVQQVAVRLPAFVPGKVRFRLSAEWIIQRLIQAPVSLVGAYMLALLGAAVGVGLQAYLTYNLPDFMDTVRITTSLVRGLVVGVVFALGIFIIRVVMERFQAAAVVPRVFFGTIAGGMALNFALLIFHVLFLNTRPRGFLITAACLLIALTFAVGGLFRSRLVRMVLSSVAVFVGIMGTWSIHTRIAVSPTDLTPVFQYDYAWTLTQVALTALGIALLIGFFGNLVDLSIMEE
jgi:serine/threonine protein kinase